MTAASIPLIRAHGTHGEAGAEVGRATRQVIAAAAGEPFDSELVGRYRAVTLEHLPWIVEELDAAAAAAGANPLAVFAASIEELSADRVEAPARCTDLVATGEATADGHVLVAHNNDLAAEEEEDVVAIEWRIPGEPTVFTLGIGPWISVGWNEAGLSVTGNEVAPNDERVGIPRLLQVRDVLTRRTLEEAVEAILHPARASSYNWVLAHRDGEAVNVEGSASDADVAEPVDSVLSHTNHYVSERMLPFEKSTDIAGSCRRAERAAVLLAEREDPVSATWLRQALSDHEGAPHSLCRHGERKETKTVFWCIADVSAGEITYGRGNPCRATAQTYRFDA